MVSGGSRYIRVAGAGSLGDRLAKPARSKSASPRPRQQPEPPGMLEPVRGNKPFDAVGTVDHTPVYPREVIKEIIDAGKRLGIGVHDHIIIGRKGYASMKGLLLIWALKPLTGAR